MTFQRPELLALAPLAALLLTLTVAAHWRRLRRLARAYELPALRRLLPADVSRFPSGRLLYLVAAGGLLGLAAAGPVVLDPEPPEPPPPLDVAIAVDLSWSMTARDVPPSRIDRARTAVDALTEALPSVRFSLLVFAAWPYTLVPPTDDPEVVRYFVDSLEPGVVQEQDRGSSLAGALAQAARTIEARPRPEARRAIVVLSDGDANEDGEDLLRAATALADAGVQVWVGGVGTAEGATLSFEGESLRDVGGRAVTVAQNEGLLRAIADAGDGAYEDISDDAGLEALVGGLRELSGETGADPPEPFDGTAILTLLAIPLLLWETVVDRGGARPAREKEGA